jgi:hypothetical protein
MVCDPFPREAGTTLRTALEDRLQGIQKVKRLRCCCASTVDSRIGTAPSFVVTGCFKYSGRCFCKTVQGIAPRQRVRPFMHQRIHGLRFAHLIIEPDKETCRAPQALSKNRARKSGERDHDRHRRRTERAKPLQGMRVFFPKAIALSFSHWRRVSFFRQRAAVCCAITAD